MLRIIGMGLCNPTEPSSKPETTYRKWRLLGSPSEKQQLRQQPQQRPAGAARGMLTSRL